MRSGMRLTVIGDDVVARLSLQAVIILRDLTNICPLFPQNHHLARVGITN